MKEAQYWRPACINVVTDSFQSVVVTSLWQNLAHSSSVPRFENHILRGHDYT